MHGWIPITAQVVAALVLIAAIGWRNRRWRLVWLPWAALVGVGLALAVYWYIASQGMSDDINPAPHALWIWIVLSGTAAGVLIAGWRGARWWRRGVSALALPLCALCAALALNLWVGYFPTVQNAWNQLTSGPLPDQTDPVTVTAMQKRHAIPPKGTVVPVNIPDTASGFKHRGELVYLPPAWYATDPPPPLPTVMMVGGEFNTPADWMRAGNAVKTIDDFAAAHGGNAPVFVFVDSGGAFNNDTECVNGKRGNAADHLTKDVVPFMVSNYRVSPNRANWGVVGWSMGGTCAVDLAVMHPDMFSAFEDIAGDLTPNSGNKAQTIAAPVRRQCRRLCGVRSDDGHHPPRPLRRGGGLVRHQRHTIEASAQRGGERGGQPQRPDCGGELAVRDGQRQRDQVCGRGAAGQARLAVRCACVRRWAAVAGGPARHTRHARDPASWTAAGGAAGAAARSAALRAVSASRGEVGLKLLGGGQRILHRIVITRRGE